MLYQYQKVYTQFSALVARFGFSIKHDTWPEFLEPRFFRLRALLITLRNNFNGDFLIVSSINESALCF